MSLEFAASNLSRIIAFVIVLGIAVIGAKLWQKQQNAGRAQNTSTRAKLFKSVLKASWEAGVVVQKTGTIVSCNKVVRSSLRKRTKEVVGQTLSLLIPAASEDRILSSFERMENDNLLDMDITVQLKRHNTLVPGRIRITRVRDSDGSASEYFGLFFRDQSEIQLARAMLSQARELNQQSDMILSHIGHYNAVEHVATLHENVTVLFCDIVGFTQLASSMSGIALHRLLDELFSMFDTVAVSLPGVEKIKTIGDCYMAAAGLPRAPCARPAHQMATFGLGILNAVRQFNLLHDRKLSVRIGLNTGPVIAGVLGSTKLSYDIWGDTVNVASRMEGCAVTDTINVSESTYLLLADEYEFLEPRTVEVKGKGPMNCYEILSTAPSTGFVTSLSTPSVTRAVSRAPSPNMFTQQLLNSSTYRSGQHLIPFPTQRMCAQASSASNTLEIESTESSGSTSDSLR